MGSSTLLLIGGWDGSWLGTSLGYMHILYTKLAKPNKMSSNNIKKLIYILHSLGTLLC
jgi:hypothetical protein